MWVSKKIQVLLDERATYATDASLGREMALGENNRLRVENARLRADLDWFKLRLNQVERERGMLIQAAIGVKIAVPEFVPTFDPNEALNPMHNPFEDLGGSAMRGVDLDPKEDFSMMPGFRGKK